MAPREFDGQPYVEDTPTLAWSMETEGMHVSTPVLNNTQRKEVTLADVYEQNEEILELLTELRDFANTLQQGIRSFTENPPPALRLLGPLLGNMQG